MTASIVGAFAAHNTTLPEKLPDIVRTVQQALESLVNGNPQADTERPKPVVPINKSVHDDHIKCLNDGRNLKMLQRYLRARHGMSPEASKPSTSRHRRREGIQKLTSQNRTLQALQRNGLE